jgi:signal transduction histidine kinase/CheY-like chemotaxis protein/ligand-binding sensor domain-containing protein
MLRRRRVECRRGQQLAMLVVLGVALSAELGGVEPYHPIVSDPVLEAWRWRSFPELKGAGLRCLAESSDGAMWFGTDDGIRRYDGRAWRRFTTEDGLLSAPVNVLRASAGGTVYAGSDMGISRFESGAWRPLFPPTPGFSWPIDKIVESSDGSLWAATAWGLLRLETGRATLFTSSDMATALQKHVDYVDISIVPDAVIPERRWGEGVGIRAAKGGYMGVSRGGLPMVAWAVAPDGPGARAGVQVGEIIAGIDGAVPQLPHIVLEGASGTSMTLDLDRGDEVQPSSLTLKRETVRGTYRDFSVSDVIESDDGKLWIGLSWGGEILCLDSNQNSWALHARVNGLHPGDRPRLIQTRDGSIWSISNHGHGGINRFDGKKWHHLSFRSDIHTSVLETDDGALWIGGHNGTLLRYNGAWSSWDSNQVPLSQTRIIDLLQAADGAVWIAGLGQEATRLDYDSSRWISYAGLNYQAESVDGTLWFLTQQRQVVAFDPRQQWRIYTPVDGLLEKPNRVISTRNGEVWAAGQHDGRAATARFAGNTWTLHKHYLLAKNIDWRSALESKDGSLWFGAAVGRVAGEGQRGGLLRFHQEEGWTHYTPPEAPQYTYAIGETSDGVMWFGGGGLKRFDGSTWSIITEPKALVSWVQALLGTKAGNLWVGTRTYGLLFYDGQEWTAHGVADGLVNNVIKGIEVSMDGTAWVKTDKGMSRYDGSTWTTQALPAGFDDRHVDLRQSSDGALWFNSGAAQTTRYQPENDAPDTRITLAVGQVSQPGNTTFIWEGHDAWRATPDARLQFSWRLDRGIWSAFSSKRNKAFFSLENGDHLFEVRARDLDLNEDPTPAKANFVVVPPVWMQPWFVSLMVVLTFAIGLQTSRVVRRDRRLRDSNSELQQQSESLQTANTKLDESNRALQEKTNELEAANVQIVEANRLKSQFLANMSHELRTPLNAILGFTQLLTRDSELGPQHRENLEVIGRSGEHLLGLINDVLDMSKIEAGEAHLSETDFDLFDLLTSLEAMFRLRAQDKGLTLSFARRDDLPRYVRADEGKLRQVLINLLSNGVKFTDAGTVTLEAGYAVERLNFDITDTGAGIALEELDILFNAFVQTESGRHAQEGTGLGLPISQEFVRLMGGEITAHSEPGRGSRFSFSISVTPIGALEVAPAPTYRRATGLSAGQREYRILVVEDRDDSRRLLLQLMKQLGFQVRQATNGQEGIAVWEEWDPDLIWMDVRMPVLDGIEATKRIKASPGGETTSVIALTASVFEEERSAVLSAGCDGFIRKPFKEGEVVECLTQQLGVRFDYEADDPLQTAPKVRVALSTGMLSELPVDWIEQLHKATTMADAERINTLLLSIEPGHEELVMALEHHVNDFRFDEIMAATQPLVDSTRE